MDNYVKTAAEFSVFIILITIIFGLLGVAWRVAEWALSAF